MADHPSSPCDRHPHHILLDKTCLIGYLENSTTAKTNNSQGLSVEVSLQTAEPPAISLCFARCVDHQNGSSLVGDAFILGDAGGFVLLSIIFLDSANHYSRFIDYFVYKAATPAGPASLRLLPRPYPSSFLRNFVAVLPVSDDNGEDDFAVVFPRVECLQSESRRRYTLHVYHSDTNAWCSQVAHIAEDDTETRNAQYNKLKVHDAMSVAYAGKGVIGWIDLWWGILSCNVLDSGPIIRFVPLPVPGPCDPSEFHLEFQDLTPRPNRHVTICNGLIRFVGLHFHVDDAFCNMKRAQDHGWMARTWTRSIYSDDVWHDGLTVDTSEIYFTDSTLPNLLPGMFDEENNLTWGKFTTAGPTLSLRDDDIIYIIAKEGMCCRTAYVLAINTKSLKLESGAHCSAQKMTCFEPTYDPCLLFSSFGTTSELAKEFETKATIMETKEGPILSVLSKRLCALRKQQNRIAQMEEPVAAGKALNQEQKEVMRSKPALAAIIDELERLRAPLAAALAEELSTISAPAASSLSFNPDSSF